MRNLYCRFLCPLGAALGLLSKLTIFGIKRWSECNTCKLCEKTCQWGAIEGPKIIMTECVRCDDCERLYMDQQKCPHWIIIRRKSEFTGASAARAAAVTRQSRSRPLTQSALDPILPSERRCDTSVLPRTKLDDAGNASLGEVSPAVEESVLRTEPRGSHAFRCVSGCAVSRVARMVHFSKTCHTGSSARVDCVKCAWKRHSVAVSRRASLGEVSPTVEESILCTSRADTHASRWYSLAARRVARDDRLTATLPH